MYLLTPEAVSGCIFFILFGDLPRSSIFYILLLYLAYLFGGRHAPRLGRALCAAAVALQAAAIASQADALFLAGLPLLLAGLLLWRPGPPRARSRLLPSRVT